MEYDVHYCVYVSVNQPENRVFVTLERAFISPEGKTFTFFGRGIFSLLSSATSPLDVTKSSTLICSLCGLLSGTLSVRMNLRHRSPG